MDGELGACIRASAHLGHLLDSREETLAAEVKLARARRLIQLVTVQLLLCLATIAAYIAVIIVLVAVIVADCLEESSFLRRRLLNLAKTVATQPLSIQL